MLYLLLCLVLIPVIILAGYAQTKVHTVYKTFSQVNTTKNRTALEVARTILDTAGLKNVTIKKVPGTLTDYYDSKHKVLALSESNYESTSIAAIGVATHEAGHALQDHQNYIPLRLRHFVIHVSNIVSKSFFPLLILSILLAIFIPTSGNVGVYLVMIFTAIYALSMLISLITLPVEFNASKRALRYLKDSQELTPQELNGAKKVLSAAALTYIASFLYNAVEFLRILIYLLMITRNDN